MPQARVLPLARHPLKEVSNDCKRALQASVPSWQVFITSLHNNKERTHRTKHPVTKMLNSASSRLHLASHLSCQTTPLFFFLPTVSVHIPFPFFFIPICAPSFFHSSFSSSRQTFLTPCGLDTYPIYTLSLLAHTFASHP